MGEELVPVAVKCVNQVTDVFGVYNIPGKIYDILEIEEDGSFVIETEALEESDSIHIAADDKDFEVIMGKEEDYGNIG